VPGLQRHALSQILERGSARSGEGYSFAAFCFT
jgi:hypothetical protein